MPDAYVRRARIAPAALVGVPGAALLIAGAASPQTALRIAGVFLGSVGIVVAILVRDAGRRIQPRLWESWGGSPTQRRLRWRDGGSEAVVDRLHKRVEAATGEALPDAEAEARDPDDANRRYDDAIGVLRERTRSAEAFPLVAAENADYGFRRNCLGVGAIGPSTSLIGFVVSLVLLLFGHGDFGARAIRWCPAAAVCVFTAIFWWLIVREVWVRTAADNYADRLLGAVDALGRPPAS
jgi:hypothetical protein